MPDPPEPPGPFTVRAVRDADSAALIELIGSCWAEYPGCVMDVDGEEPWLRAPATAYAAWGGLLWVVPGLDAGRPAGGRPAGGRPAGGRPAPGSLAACAGVKPAGPGAVELKNMYVAAAARRRGLGTYLVALVRAEAGRRGASRVHLWSDTRFTDAHRLYGRTGFARTGRTRDLHDLSRTTEYEFSLTAAEPEPEPGPGP